jgi:hypothetical protein
MTMDSEDSECVAFHTLKDISGMKHFDRSVVDSGVKVNCRLGGYASTEEERNAIAERVIQVWKTLTKDEV